MAIQMKITAEQFAKLSDEMKAQYIEKDGAYSLDVTGGSTDDTGALKRAKDRATQERNEANDRAKIAEDKLSALDNNDARKTGDIARLDKSHQDALSAQKAASDKTIGEQNAFIQKTLVDNAASAMANKISTSPAVVQLHIAGRVRVGFESGAPVTTYHDANGAVVTADALEKEFVDNPDFKSIMVANQSSGGGAPMDDQKPGSAVKTGTPPNAPISLANASAAELVAHVDARNAERK